MLAGTLLFDYTALTAVGLDPGCCPHNIYVLLFNQNAQAIKLNINSKYEFATYAKSTHATFAIVLGEHAERSFHYTSSVPPTSHVVPATPDNEYYYLEVWHREGDTAYNRDEDTLLEVRRVYFTGETLSPTRLTAADVDASADWNVEVAMAYDSQNSRVNFVAWLEKNGELVTDAARVELRWLDRSGAELSHDATSSGLAGFPGFFLWDKSLTDLDPDQATPVTVAITDADGVEHTGGASSVTWD